MATRFYFPTAGTAPCTPAFDGGWEQTGQAVRFPLIDKKDVSALQALANGTAITVPITTTQDYLWAQFISDVIPPQRLIGNFSLVIRVFENATTNNVTLSVVAKVVSQDGNAIRGVLFSNFNQDTEFPLSASAATRIVAATAVTPLTTLPGDRIAIEIGGHGTGPTVAGSFTTRPGFSAATDFALTTALTTDLNPWCEFSENLWPSLPNNFKFASAVSAGVTSVTEKIR